MWIEETSGLVSFCSSPSCSCLYLGHSSGHGLGRGTSTSSTPPPRAARRRPCKGRGILLLLCPRRAANGPRTHPAVHVKEQGVISLRICGSSSGSRVTTSELFKGQCCQVYTSLEDEVHESLSLQLAQIGQNQCRESCKVVSDRG